MVGVTYKVIKEGQSTVNVFTVRYVYSLQIVKQLLSKMFAKYMKN